MTSHFTSSSLHVALKFCWSVDFSDWHFLSFRLNSFPQVNWKKLKTLKIYIPQVHLFIYINTPSIDRSPAATMWIDTAWYTFTAVTWWLCRRWSYRWHPRTRGHQKFTKIFIRQSSCGHPKYIQTNRYSHNSSIHWFRSSSGRINYSRIS